MKQHGPRTSFRILAVSQTHLRKGTCNFNLYSGVITSGQLLTPSALSETLAVQTAHSVLPFTSASEFSHGPILKDWVLLNRKVYYN